MSNHGSDVLRRMFDSGLIAIIRAPAPGSPAPAPGGTESKPGDGGADCQALVDLCKALRDGGVEVTEITMTTPGALQAISAARQALGDDAVIGVGSVLDAQTAQAAILAGAQFIVSPTTNLGVIQTAHRYGLPVVPGALTPTEIMTAFEAGADVVKVFPANHFGPKYLKDLLAPMPQLRLAPTGGVNLETINDWIAAGAACLGVGTSLCRKELVQGRDWAALSKLAGQYVQAVRQARETS